MRAKGGGTLAAAFFIVACLSGVLLVLHIAGMRNDALLHEPRGFRRQPGRSSGEPNASAAAIDTCYTAPHTEYEGSVEIWGQSNILPSAAACCESCRAHRAQEEAAGRVGRGCLLWVYCAAPEGCPGGQPAGACWGKRYERERDGLAPRIRGRGEGVQWTSGAVFTEAEASQVFAAERAERAAVEARRERPGNPRVFFDVEIDGTPSGRIEFVLYAHESPRHAENFRAMCTGERGGKKSFRGMRFYRIIDRFIDQAGANGVGSIWDEPFDDDPGGLALHHDRDGLLSSANAGPNTNSGHFSIVVAPAPHLDGSYTVFGEVVSGMQTVMAINRLTTPGTDKVTGNAIVVAAGCLRNCAARPEVTPKCKTRGNTKARVQGKIIMRPCLD